MAVYRENSIYSPSRLFQHQYTPISSRIQQVSSPKKVKNSITLSITALPMLCTAAITA